MFTLPSAASLFGKSSRKWPPRLSLRSMAAARDGFGNREQIFQINRRMPAGIVFAMAINGDASGAFPKFGESVKRANHFLLAPHDADESLHHFLQIMLHLIRAFGAARCVGAAIKWFQRLARGFFKSGRR